MQNLARATRTAVFSGLGLAGKAVSSSCSSWQLTELDEPSGAAEAADLSNASRHWWLLPEL
jgi:hypothetical protein